jgi:hypothetical protein
MSKLIKVMKSDKPKKKWTAVFKLDNGKEKKVHFGSAGMNDYTLTGDKEARERYRKRTKNQIENPNTTPLSPSYLSYYILWGDSTDIKKNISSYKKRFNL